MLFSAFPAAMPALAAETEKTVYLDAAGGNDSADGSSPSSAFKTLPAAITALAASGGRIVITSDLSLTGSEASQFQEPTHTGKIVISSKDSTKDYGTTLKLQGGMVYALNGPTEFADVKIDTGKGNTVIAAQFNPLVIGENVTCSGANTFLLGGYQTPKAGSNVNKNSSITVKSGTFGAVVGFSRTKGAGTQTYTGKAMINVYGGSIGTVYGASLYNHFSGSLDVKVYGGNIATLSTGGDVTRRLNGTSNIEIYGGTVKIINIANAIGDTTIKLDGGAITAITEEFRSTTIQSDASAAIRTLSYNSLSFTAEKIQKLSGKIIDKISSYGTAYLKEGATGSGKNENDPTGNISTAIELVGNGGGNVAVIGSYTLSEGFTEPAHQADIGFISFGDGSALKLSDGASYTLSGNTVFGIPVNGKNTTINANGFGVTFDDKFDSNGELTVIGTSDSSKSANVYLKAGSVKAVYGSENGTSAPVVIDIAGGKVSEVRASAKGKTDGNVSLFFTAGEIAKLDLTEVYGSLTISLQGGTLAFFDAGVSGKLNENAVYTLTYDNAKFDSKLFDADKELFGAVSTQKTVYVKDGGTGNGLSYANPTNFANAFTVLAETGGVIVIIGETTIGTSVNTTSNKAPITVTSVAADTDYRTSGAYILLGANITFNGPVIIENVNITLDKNAPVFKFNGHNSTLGDNINITMPSKFTSYPNIIAGSSANVSDKEYTLTINSGLYNSVNLVSDKKGSTAENISATLVINGGEFFSQIFAAGVAKAEGKITVTVNGGIIRSGLYACSSADDGSTFSGTLTYNLNGGTYIGKIAPAYSKSTKLSGDFYLNLNGGTFNGITNLIGPDEYAGNMKPHVTVSSNVDIFAKEEGTTSHQNPIVTAADPWVIYKDGYYYFTRTAGSSIGVAKATNLGDLATAKLEVVFDPPNGQMYSKNLWSPELHYYYAEDFEDEDFGPEMEGWYILLACDDGDNYNHRMYCIKALTDDPQGPYGHPLTKEVNIPIKILSDTDPTVGEKWAAGQTDGRINGDLYCFWVSEESNGVDHRYQTLNISKMKNPWTLTGKTSVICKPTEPWEKHGATYKVSADGKIYPEVVEGIATVTSPEGVTYLLYAGSGYWTPYYCIAQLKLVGDDPTDYDSWYKYPEPILNKSDELNGTGHCCYTVSPDGKTNYIVYHAYVGTDTNSGRYMIAQEYTFTENGVKIGDGLGKPAPISTVYTYNVNPMPLIKKLVGWGSEIKSFITIENLTTPAGTVINVVPTLSNNAAYSEAEHGKLEYKFRKAGTLEAYTHGLPTEEGEYQVIATLAGNDNYSGISTEFSITLTKAEVITTEAPETTENGTEQTPSASAAPIGIIVAVIAAVAIVGTAIFVIAKKKKK